jgi:muramidase (phage lysozyme)
VTFKTNDSSAQNQQKTRSGNSGTWWYLISGVAILMFVFEWRGVDAFRFRFGRSIDDPEAHQAPAPLAMKGGDPYIRALMRTISASEANSSHPYSLLYGGEHFQDFSHHPDTCVTIVSGPNTGNCTTAAGRYQMLTTTWLSKAQEYHPQKSSFLFWESYSFDPDSQDEVVYRWLDDPQAWGSDLSQLLHQGEVNEVLKMLSPTWTSLGYGIESNSMTSALPDIYQEVLQEELQTTNGQTTATAKDSGSPAHSQSTEPDLLDLPLRQILPHLFGTN